MDLLTMARAAGLAGEPLAAALEEAGYPDLVPE